MPCGGTEWVFFVGLLVLVQVLGIVDFNFNGDPKSDYQVCCMVEHSFPQDPFRKCYEAHRTPQIDNQTIMCIHRCYYDAIGMFNGDKLQLDKYLAYRDQMEPSLKKSFTYMLEFCRQFVSKQIQASPEVVKRFRCSPVPYMFNRCLAEVGQANCPQDRWMNSSLCDTYAMRIKKKYGPTVKA